MSQFYDDACEEKPIIGWECFSPRDLRNVENGRDDNQNQKALNSFVKLLSRGQKRKIDSPSRNAPNLYLPTTPFRTSRASSTHVERRPRKRCRRPFPEQAPLDPDELAFLVNLEEKLKKEQQEEEEAEEDRRRRAMDERSESPPASQEILCSTPNHTHHHPGQLSTAGWDDSEEDDSFMVQASQFAADLSAMSVSTTPHGSSTGLTTTTTTAAAAAATPHRPRHQQTQQQPLPMSWSQSALAPFASPIPAARPRPSDSGARRSDDDSLSDLDELLDEFPDIATQLDS